MGRLPKSIVSLAAVRRASDILAPRLNPGQGGLADMGALEVAGVREIHHYTPLHYLPFIARAGALLSKPTMRPRGFQDSHVARGFWGVCISPTTPCVAYFESEARRRVSSRAHHS